MLWERIDAENTLENLLSVSAGQGYRNRFSLSLQLGFVYGRETLPFGINGAYYYFRAGYRF